MRWRALASVLFGLLAAVPSAWAADFGLGLRAGTQGFGGELGMGLGQHFALRAGYYKASVSGDYDDTDITYDGDLDVGGTGLIADFYPFKNGFHISAGYFSNDNAIGLEATPTGPQEIGDTTYTPAEIGTLTGDVAFDDTAPYFGLGWGRLTGAKRLGFLVDLGFLKQGSGDVTLVSSTGLVAQDDLDAEVAEIEDDIKDYDFWPVLSFGLAIRF